MVFTMFGKILTVPPANFFSLYSLDPSHVFWFGEPNDVCTGPAEVQGCITVLKCANFFCVIFNLLFIASHVFFISNMVLLTQHVLFGFSNTCPLSITF